MMPMNRSVVNRCIANPQLDLCTQEASAQLQQSGSRIAELIPYNPVEHSIDDL